MEIFGIVLAVGLSYWLGKRRGHQACDKKWNHCFEVRIAKNRREIAELEEKIRTRELNVPHDSCGK